jgi:GT2 family glycosyltransferase
LVPIEVIRRVGSFDQKNFPHYVSDYDYFLRAKRMGFRLLLSCEAVVYSRTDLTGFRPKDEHLTVKEIWTKLFSIRSAGNLQNTLRFNWKYAPTLWLKIYSNVKFILWTARWVTASFLWLGR